MSEGPAMQHENNSDSTPFQGQAPENHIDIPSNLELNQETRNKDR